MFDTIVLLTGPLERPVLASTLRAQNPQLNVRAVETAADLAAIEPDVLAHARLVAFATPIIVPARVLGRLGYGAYNFHPGPAEFPGWAASQFAIYRGATAFGATAHRMIEQVDAGPIVAVERFCMTADISVGELEKLTYAHLAKIFWRLANVLATQSEALIELPIQWSGQKSTRRQYAALCDIPPDISKQELDRRIKAFGGDHFGVMPTIALHGREFKFVSSEISEGSAQVQAVGLPAGVCGLKSEHAA